LKAQQIIIIFFGVAMLAGSMAAGMFSGRSCYILKIPNYILEGRHLQQPVHCRKKVLSSTHQALDWLYMLAALPLSSKADGMSAECSLLCWQMTRLQHAGG
jgi:hypothetical protein